MQAQGSTLQKVDIINIKNFVEDFVEKDGNMASFNVFEASHFEQLDACVTSRVSTGLAAPDPSPNPGPFVAYFVNGHLTSESASILRLELVRDGWRFAIVIRYSTLVLAAVLSKGCLLPSLQDIGHLKYRLI